MQQREEPRCSREKKNAVILTLSEVEGEELLYLAFASVVARSFVL
jgi:hypothetical protein